jgi:hypothetical protein
VLVGARRLPRLVAVFENADASFSKMTLYLSGSVLVGSATRLLPSRKLCKLLCDEVAVCCASVREWPQSDWLLG